MSLRKPGRESDLQIMNFINSYSPSFCLAKYYNATIWLGSGMTTSCHHPLPHKIPINEVIKTPSVLHNTEQKKSEREMMKKGQKPSGCDYCWKMEGINKETVSDRVYKTVIYDDKDLDYAFSSPYAENFNLKTLEIAFDRTCQFACSYCNPAFSSTWASEIKTNGPYIGLVSDGRNHYTHEHSSSQLFKVTEENPYVTAFFKWWESDLHKTLQELRITGGEPMMSPHMWTLMDWFANNKDKNNNMRLAINSNLGAKDDLIDRFIEKSKNIQHLHLYTSCEALGKQAEYIRDGLVWQQWTDNVEKILQNTNIEGLHMMCTINALCLDSLPDFLDVLMNWKLEYGKDFPTFTLNVLRFPSFQSPLILPTELKDKYRANLINWLNSANKEFLHEMEINHVKRLIDYLDAVKTPHDGVSNLDDLHHDFKQFYCQYDKRRNKKFEDTFPNLVSWYNTL